MGVSGFILGYTHPLPSACWDTPLPVQCMLGYGQQAGGTHPTGMHSCYQWFGSSLRSVFGTRSCEITTDE